ncbi:hypothetical protein EW146_g1808 [Bondarzewia mesenterica]|uniref:BTB domain-containing protein n=1 Tax=Bondarzewia mesenterica TaxID=1095465 RepID=A0A4S4M2I8_9AGAM|nr:hypothetical protein EW146_g1808 [Bondarzewia mesenterica]
MVDTDSGPYHERFHILDDALGPHHERFYILDDALGIFRIDERLYRVHRYLLIRESGFFRDMFSCPSGDTQDVEGLTDENPIILAGTTKMEFESVLQFLYFGMHDDYKASLEVWLAMLSISTRLLFDKIRQRAIKEITAQLDRMDPINLILLATEHDVPQWLQPAYERLVSRAEPLSHAEAKTLDLPTAMMLMRSRELHHRAGNPRGPGWGGSVNLSNVVRSEVNTMRSA